MANHFSLTYLLKFVLKVTLWNISQDGVTILSIILIVLEQTMKINLREKTVKCPMLLYCWWLFLRLFDKSFNDININFELYKSLRWGLGWTEAKSLTGHNSFYEFPIPCYYLSDAHWHCNKTLIESMKCVLHSTILYWSSRKTRQVRSQDK